MRPEIEFLQEAFNEKALPITIRETSPMEAELVAADGKKIGIINIKKVGWLENFVRFYTPYVESQKESRVTLNYPDGCKESFVFGSTDGDPVMCTQYFSRTLDAKKIAERISSHLTLE